MEEEEGAFSRKEEEEKEAKGSPTVNWRGGRGFTAVGRGMKKSPGIKTKIIQLQFRKVTKMSRERNISS